MAKPRKTASSQLEECEYGCLLTPLSQSAVALVRLDRTGRIAWTSGAWAQLVGGSSNVRRKRLEQYIVKEDRELLSSVLSRFNSGSEAGRCEVRIGAVRGVVHHAELRISPAPGGVFVVMIDVTERSARLAWALECAGQGLWDWDVPSGRVLYARPDGPSGSGGLRWREQTAREWGEQSHPHDQALASEQIRRVLNGETDRFLTMVRMRPSQNVPWRHYESRGRVIAWDRTGKPTRIVGLFRNVTEVIRDEQESRQRESAIAQTSLLFSMEELASSLAHELNQPLGAMSNFLRAAVRMLDRPDPDVKGARAAMAKAIAAAQVPPAIVRGLRNLFHRANPRGEPVVIRRLLEEAIASLAHAAKSHGVQLELQVGDGLLTVAADPVQIGQVLRNLLQNAIDALQSVRRRNRRVCIAAKVSEDRLSVSVSDNGPGIDAQMVKDLFTPFKSTKSHGTGLGLAISRSIVEAHGGRLWLATNGPGGATMCFEIPLRRQRK